MSEAITCARCGSDRLEPGAIRGTEGGVWFRPTNIKFLTLVPNVPVSASVCLHCGAIELVADVAKAKKLIRR